MGSKKISELTELSTADFNPAAAYMIIEQGGVTYKMRMSTGVASSDTSSSFVDSKTGSISKAAGKQTYYGSTITFNTQNIVSQATALQVQISCKNTERGYEAGSFRQDGQYMELINKTKNSTPLSKPSGLTLFNGAYSTSSSFSILIGSYSGYGYSTGGGGKSPRVTQPLTSSVYAKITSSQNSFSVQPYIQHNLPSGQNSGWWLGTWVQRYSSCLAAQVTVSVSGTIRS